MTVAEYNGMGTASGPFFCVGVALPGWTEVQESVYNSCTVHTV